MACQTHYGCPWIQSKSLCVCVCVCVCVFRTVNRLIEREGKRERERERKRDERRIYAQMKFICRCVVMRVVLLTIVYNLS